MPAELQKAIDLTLTNCKNTYAYQDDILIITKGSVEKHKDTLEKVLHKLDEENLTISLDKCKFACKQIEWLGFHIDSEGTTPLSRKTDAIENLFPPKTFKQLNFHGINTSSYKVYPTFGTGRCGTTSSSKKFRQAQNT